MDEIRYLSFQHLRLWRTPEKMTKLRSFDNAALLLLEKLKKKTALGHEKAAFGIFEKPDQWLL